MKLDKILSSKIGQKILLLIVSHPDKQFYEREIVKLANVSVGGANQILKVFARLDLIKLDKKGRMNFYQANLSNPLTREFKILENIARLGTITDKLKLEAQKIILFGSAAEGTNLAESDFDFFVITTNHQKIEKIINESVQIIQAIIKTPEEVEGMISRNDPLWQEIERGIVLFDKEQNGT